MDSEFVELEPKTHLWDFLRVVRGVLFVFIFMVVCVWEGMSLTPNRNVKAWPINVEKCNIYLVCPVAMVVNTFALWACAGMKFGRRLKRNDLDFLVYGAILICFACCVIAIPIEYNCVAHEIHRSKDDQLRKAQQIYGHLCPDLMGGKSWIFISKIKNLSLKEIKKLCV